MSSVFFDDLEHAEPDIHLDVGSDRTPSRRREGHDRLRDGPAGARPTGRRRRRREFDARLRARRREARVPVAHVEAGLRSFDRAMPEEINRMVTDLLSRLLLHDHRAEADTNLLARGGGPGRIFFVGNVMIDTLAPATSDRPEPIADPRSARPAPGRLRRSSRCTVPPTSMTPRSLRAAGCARRHRGTLPVVFPVHPRTRKMIGSAAARSRSRPG